MKNSSRRSFIKKTSTFAGLAPFIPLACKSMDTEDENKKLSLHVFSKHLQFLPYKEVGEKAAELGFDGVDLTVRPKGHVSPESVKDDLPRAIEEIKQGGSPCTMMTTAVDDATDQIDKDVLETAAAQGITYYRANWFKFPKEGSMEKALDGFQERLHDLSLLNKELGLIGAYQNHAGTGVGASVWELDKIVKTADPEHFGLQYDIRHATVEGGLSWTNGIRLLHTRIKTLALKDFKWGKVDGKWKPINTPIGEGMVDFKKYFGLLKQYKVHVPVSMHFEYPLGGANHGDRELTVAPEVVYEAMKKDIAKIHQLWEEA